MASFTKQLKNSNAVSSADIALTVPPAALPVREGDTTSKTGIVTQEEKLPCNNWQKWFLAFKQIWPVYLATHLAFLILTYLASLFSVENFSEKALSLSTLLDSWNRWDTSHFTTIATKGYDIGLRAAFFPLYPLLERGLMLLTRDPFVAGLIISNLAMLGLFVVLYRLIEEDFTAELASRTVLYLAVFPTAFFLAAAYNESIFLCFALLTFYHIRHSQWWWAGLFGLLAALTRSSGLFLLVPFCYEYLRQHRFQIKTVRFDILSGLLIPAGLGIFAIYCYLHYHDLFAFSHAQSAWNRASDFPWKGFTHSLAIIAKRGVLTFDSMHNIIDLTAGLFMLCLTIFSFVGPWKFARDLRVYALYAAAFYLFLILFPASGGFPLQSLSRQVIELFPAFIVLAAIGKRVQFNLYYLMLSGAMLCFMLLQFLTGRWIV